VEKYININLSGKIYSATRFIISDVVMSRG
jgi:hypothetical protein